jgi:phage repressor protein C with HTH and peptisase S24 domain
LLKNKYTVEFDSLMEIIETKLSQGSEVIILATGNSMMPLFKHKRDQVCLIKERNLKKYDMILYRRLNGQYVLHRIVGKNSDGFILRGDNQLENEYSIQLEQVIAKVISFKRKGKDYRCTNLIYSCYARVWVNTCWLRHLILKIKVVLSTFSSVWK